MIEFINIDLQEYEEEHGPTPKEDVETNDNIGGKSNSSSGTGTPRGQNSRSVSPTHENSTTSKTQESTNLQAKTDSSTSQSYNFLYTHYNVIILTKALINKSYCEID